jgi:hypothetical protein
MNAPITELERLAEADGATFIPSGTGSWAVRDKDGMTIARGALSRAEAARLYCEELDLCLSTPEAALAYIKAQRRPYGFPLLKEDRPSVNAPDDGRI